MSSLASSAPRTTLKPRRCGRSRTRPIAMQRWRRPSSERLSSARAGAASALSKETRALSCSAGSPLRPASAPSRFKGAVHEGESAARGMLMGYAKAAGLG
jgi:hypothetical protein